MLTRLKNVKEKAQRLRRVEEQAESRTANADTTILIKKTPRRVSCATSIN